MHEIELRSSHEACCFGLLGIVRAKQLPLRFEGLGVAYTSERPSGGCKCIELGVSNLAFITSIGEDELKVSSKAGSLPVVHAVLNALRKGQHVEEAHVALNADGPVERGPGHVSSLRVQPERLAGHAQAGRSTDGAELQQLALELGQERAETGVANLRG